MDSYPRGPWNRGVPSRSEASSTGLPRRRSAAASSPRPIATRSSCPRLSRSTPVHGRPGPRRHASRPRQLCQLFQPSRGSCSGRHAATPRPDTSLLHFTLRHSRSKHPRKGTSVLLSGLSRVPPRSRSPHCHRSHG